MKYTLCYIFTLFALVVTNPVPSLVKLCVPRKFLADCTKLHGSDGTSGVQCVPARDRMECLEKVKRREADVVAVDPEDMYVAYHLDNQDFDVISEIRTVEEIHAPFRYDGIILVRKGSDIHSIKDLRGKKSCHTGFGRNVGYKIPLTKLRKHDALKLSTDTELSSTEKELEALSNFFEKSCIVGNYSPDKNVDEILKKRYSNLCAICENPGQCNYPDKYSGYDGAVRCVVEGRGDVAFTKTYFVKKHFGLPISQNDSTNAMPDASNYEVEYLCEDGTRKAITDPNPCSWAQRPWQGYMTHADILPAKTDVQQKLKSAFENGKTTLTTDEQLHLFIKPDWTVYENTKVIYPGDHLFKAQYKDVIERDGTEPGVIRLCVTSDIEYRKCKWLKRAAYSRDIRPQIECVLKDVNECERSLTRGKADVVVLSEANAVKGAQENNLLQLLTETYPDVYVGIVDASTTSDSIQTGGVQFDRSNPRALSAALFFNSKRNIRVCPSSLVSSNTPVVTVTSSKNLDTYKGQNKKLVCSDLSTKELSEFSTCNIDYSLPNGIFVRSNESRQIKENIKHLFVSIAKAFGPSSKISDVFDVFGDFEEGQRGVIFSADASDIVPEGPAKIDKSVYSELHCY